VGEGGDTERGGGRGLTAGRAGVLPSVEEQMRAKIAIFPPAQRIMAQRALDFVMPLLSDIAGKTLALLQKSHVKQGSNFTGNATGFRV
jgi:hypothetical protein